MGAPPDGGRFGMGEAKRRSVNPTNRPIVPDTGTFDDIAVTLTPDNVAECFQLNIKHREVRLHGAELVDLKRKIDDAFLQWVQNATVLNHLSQF